MGRELVNVSAVYVSFNSLGVACPKEVDTHQFSTLLPPDLSAPHPGLSSEQILPLFIHFVSRLQRSADNETHFRDANEEWPCMQHVQ